MRGKLSQKFGNVIFTIEEEIVLNNAPIGIRGNIVREGSAVIPNRKVFSYFFPGLERFASLAVVIGIVVSVHVDRRYGRDTDNDIFVALQVVVVAVTVVVVGNPGVFAGRIVPRGGCFDGVKVSEEGKFYNSVFISFAYGFNPGELFAVLPSPYILLKGFRKQYHLTRILYFFNLRGAFFASALIGTVIVNTKHEYACVGVFNDIPYKVFGHFVKRLDIVGAKPYIDAVEVCLIIFGDKDYSAAVLMGIVSAVQVSDNGGYRFKQFFVVGRFKRFITDGNVRRRSANVQDVSDIAFVKGNNVFGYFSRGGS